MECSSLLKHAIENENVESRLFRGSPDKAIVTDLQRTLFELGFRKKLKWEKYQADGRYGRATAAAVLDFANRNNIASDGNRVTTELAQKILQRHEFLPSLYLLWQIHASDLRSKKYISKGTKISIIAIQVLMNELGYGIGSSNAKHQEDGIYSENLRLAVVAFANDNRVNTDGDWLSRPLINLLLKKINLFYGKNWTDLALNNLPSRKSPLVMYHGSRFVGNACRSDIEFIPMLEKVNLYAEQADVFVHVTSSFRTTTNVQGAIVPPATFSNHLVGHGIDMNVKYGNNELANSKVLVQYPNVPDPVRAFLKLIIADPELRWGGLFNTKDPVHIDDWYNRDKARWRIRYEVMQRAVQLGAT